MKRLWVAQLGICIQLLATDNNSSCDVEFTSKSYIAPVEHFQTGSPELISGIRSEHLYENDWATGLSALFIGSKTRKGDDYARYFFPNGKTELTVGNNTDASGEFDLFASHFNIFTASQTEDFESSISIQPERTVYGVGLLFTQCLYADECSGNGLWMSVSGPILHVKHDLNFSEKIQNSAGGALKTADVSVVANMTEAFVQSEWNYGKIAMKAQEKTRLAHIDVTFGYEWTHHVPAHFQLYGGIRIPTGNSPKGEFLFEPVVGNGGHFGLIGGSTASLVLWHDDCADSMLNFELSSNATYLFKKKQIRSFDLQHKPWSRYMEVYQNKAEAQKAAALEDDTLAINFATPGINVFTRPVDVTPGFALQVNNALIFDHKQLRFELGYNLFAKSKECVELTDFWPTTIALKHILGSGQTTTERDISDNNALEGIGYTGGQGLDITDAITNLSNPEISENMITDQQVGILQNLLEVLANPVTPIALADYQKAVITQDQLDLSSAAMPTILAHTVYGQVGYELCWCNTSVLFDLGGSYQFSGKNNAVESRWSAWTRLSILL